MAEKIYTLKTDNKKDKQINITLSEELENQKVQADKDYDTSKSYINQHEKYIWRGGFKAYHMSTYDRKIILSKENEHWRQNISIGLVRSFVDVLKASVRENPLTFIGTGINKLGIENKENILNTLKYVSDVTGFHKQLKKTMGDGLLTGMICMRIGYKKTKNKEDIISIVNGVPTEETIEMESMNYPYAVNVPVFNIFPDPRPGVLRYVTERGVVGYENFIETFGHFIRSKTNKSPFKDYLQYLTVNTFGTVDYGDYGNIVNKVHQKKNEEYQQQDFYSKNTNDTGNTITVQNNYEDSITEGLIEFKITWYKSRVVLIANGYPIYIGENPYGFIPYVIKAANETDTRFGEGLPYLIKPLEDVGNSFINNYFDGARSIAQPTFVANKNLMVNDVQLQNGTPGGVVRTESTDGGNAIYRLDKGSIQDYSILAIIQQIAQQITGISEYNLGVAARERTATGALAVTQSSHKRMSPYISNFLDAISEIAYMWLALIKKYWITEQFIFVLDEDGRQVAQAIKNKDLTGGINISLQAEGMFGAVNELELQKLISIYQTIAGSGMVMAPELIKEIIKKTGFDPSRFMVEEKEQQPVPDNLQQPQEQQGPPGVFTNPDLDLGQIIQQSINPQQNLGNEGQGQQ